MAQRVWFITGAAGGLGRHMTEQLLRRGERVAATARRIERLDDLAAEHGERLWRAELDMTDTAAIRRVVADAAAALGSIDVAISNAGYVLLGPAESLADEEIARQIGTNLTGPIQLLRALVSRMRAQGGGRIIQISSEYGQATRPGISLYHATKWGIEGFCESLMQEIDAFDIKLSLVEPGGVATGFRANAVITDPMPEAYKRTAVGMYFQLLAMGRFPEVGDPAKVAGAILALADLERPPRRLVLGSDGWRNIERALRQRLAELELQKESAKATDIRVEPPGSA
jgi:NAD(P)-dependent dehydrogenase (short-subunit alcohol dehydrogenase family)